MEDGGKKVSDRPREMSKVKSCERKERLARVTLEFYLIQGIQMKVSIPIELSFFEYGAPAE